MPTLKKKPVVVRDGNLILTVNGDVFPAALPEDVAAPITLVVTGSIETAGGYGSLTSFELVLHRLFRYHGEQRSYLSGKCSHDSLLARMNDVFGDGTEVAGTLVRPCRVRR